MKYLIITFLVMSMSCKSTKQATVEDVTSLGEKFTVEKMEKSAVALSVKPTIKLDFKNNRISGNAGCNDYSGTIAVTGDKIKISRIMATKMYCNNMKIEKEFMLKLKSITSFKVDGKQFLLLDNTKKTVLTCNVKK